MQPRATPCQSQAWENAEWEKRLQTMALTVGTSYFVNQKAAQRYYRDYGLDVFDVVRKITEGEIHVGKPTLKPGETLSVIDDGTRYAITEASPAETVAAQRARYLAYELTHSEYYAWLCKFAGITMNMVEDLRPKVMASKDPHFNDIALHIWDNRHNYVVNAIRSKRLPWSLSDSVCCLKELARQMRAGTTLQAPS